MFEEEILFKIHNDIIINHGNKYDEYPEQFLSVKFISRIKVSNGANFK